MNKSPLEIFIITYNRSDYLLNTLNTILKSEFRKFKINVLDNCSTDSTEKICNSSEILSKINYVRHCINIGACANFMTAIQLSKAKYTWVLCDDDFYDFKEVESLISILELSNYDLIHVGAHGTNWTHPGAISNAKNLIKKGYEYFKFSSFIPCNIFKTNLFQENYLIRGYEAINTQYPHMPYIQDVYFNDRDVYINTKKLITANGGSSYYSQKQWFIWWIKVSSLIETVEGSRLFFLNHFGNIIGDELLWHINNLDVEDISFDLYVQPFFQRCFKNDNPLRSNRKNILRRCLKKLFIK